MRAGIFVVKGAVTMDGDVKGYGLARPEAGVQYAIAVVSS